MAFYNYNIIVNDTFFILFKHNKLISRIINNYYNNYKKYIHLTSDLRIKYITS